MNTSREIVKTLQLARKNLNIKANNIASTLRMGPDALTILEGDKDPNPRLDTVIKYAEAVGMELALIPKEK